MDKNILLIRYESLVQDKRILANKMEFDMQEYGSWQQDHNYAYTQLLKQEDELLTLIKKRK